MVSSDVNRHVKTDGCAKAIILRQLKADEGLQLRQLCLVQHATKDANGFS
jgi:hypothetical protein